MDGIKMCKKRIEPDFLQKKTEQLQALQESSTAAVDMVTATIDCLQTTNTEIECVVNEIRDYKAGLEIKDHELVGIQEKNARIIQNFRKLIEG